MKQKTHKIISAVVILLLAIGYLVKFGGPPTLKLYIETSMGNCQKRPILCLAPVTEILNPKINQDYLNGLKQYKFPGIALGMPADFKIIKGETVKSYSKRMLRKKSPGNVAYLLYEEPRFFANLFPQVQRQSVQDNYAFMLRVMSGRTQEINNVTDAFFVIMKTIFVPYLGEGPEIKMVKFILNENAGFINYSLSASGNYFDCNIIDSQDNFFKVYIKDASATLSLEKVLAIISTVKKTTVN
ncbi:MAG: hypothetical protein HZC16_02965 [Candidatus Omnitrophica bacterium]|nr:hypothetical protein [Candidatus Omnitrophota bacterium]